MTSRIVELISELRLTTFFDDPASTKYHGSHQRGLLEHSVNVCVNLQVLTRNMGLRWADEESPLIIGIAHDLCKVGAYTSDGNGKYRMTEGHPMVTGRHGELSVEMVRDIIDITDEEEACIRYHMGAFYPEDNKGYTDAIRRWPNVLWTHTADMMAAHIDEIRDKGTFVPASEILAGASRSGCIEPVAPVGPSFYELSEEDQAVIAAEHGRDKR